MSTFEIDTTQNVGIRFQTANAIERILARIIDVVATIIVFYAALLPIGVLSAFDSANDASWLLIVLGVAVILVLFFYPFLMETFFHGQTIGKMAMNIRVVRSDGTEPTVGGYAIRFLIGVFEIMLTMGSVATIVCLASKSGQRLGDMAAGTLVVRKAKKVTLAQVGMVANQPDRVIKYQGAGKLSPADISVLKEVLMETLSHDRTLSATMVLLAAAKERFELVLDEKSQESPLLFLQTVLEDYNAIHGAPSGVVAPGRAQTYITNDNAHRG